MKATKVGILIGITALIAPQLAMAVMTFDQLTDDIFVVSHRVKIWGSRGQAMRMVYEKAASLCVAAGYSHLEILEQESEAWQEDDSANASIRARFFFEGGGERIDCRRNATPEYVRQAGVKLEKRGYQPPEAPSTTAELPAESESCTAEQMAVMVKIGLTAEQILAACSD